MPDILPTIDNEPAQGIQALLDTVYLWNQDVANNLIEKINELLKELEDLTASGKIKPYSELTAPVHQYLPMYYEDGVYVAAQEISTLPSQPDMSKWILIATKGGAFVAGDGIDISEGVISVEQDIIQGASAGSTAVQPGDLAAVATSGDYDDLSNKPTLGTAASADITDFATAAQGVKADTAVQPEDLATVATTGDYEDLSNLPQINGVTLIGNKTSADLGITTPKYLSVERLGAYVYKATFDSIPEYDPTIAASVIGNCTSFVRDGKLYRNFDWKYDNRASFIITCKDFQGMAYINGLDDGDLDVKKIEQLPYHLVDGINSDGIMVSTHVLYNDWTYAGAGDKDQDIMLLPYYILNNLHSISDINTVLANYVANIKIPDVLANAEYLLQFVVTDGTNTYCVMPPASATGSYVIQDITSNPKLTNFRWVSDATVVRTELQTRPTGVERWNEVATSDLEDLRFTKCYQSATRLSEFIGIDDTTKDSTDAELTAIYDLAHAEYQIRTRDGNLWQTVHSVVYGNGIEHLWCQENYGKDYIGEPETVVKNVITLTGESGRLTPEQIAKVLDDTVVLEIVCDGQVFRLSNKDSSLTYRTYLNEDCALNENVVFKAIYIQLNSSAVNYGAWSLEEVSAGGGSGNAVPQYETMPTASESNVGEIAQYSGESILDSYQNGYFYKSSVEYTDPTATISQTTGSGLSDLSVNVDTFIEAEQPTQDETVSFVANVTPDTMNFSTQSGDITFSSSDASAFKNYVMEWTGGTWYSNYNNAAFTYIGDNTWSWGPQEGGIFRTFTTDELTAHGISIVGTPADGDTVFYSYIAGETSWTKNGTTVDLANYGISYSGTPVDGDTLTVAYTAPAPIGYSWKQTDVQPGGSGGGNAGIEWKTKVDLPAEYYGDEYSARPYYTISGGLPDGEYEFYFSTKTTTEGSNVPFGEVIYKVIMKIDNTNRVASGRIGYVFNGGYLNDGNTVYGTGFTLWSLVLGNNGDIVLFNTEKPWASAILGYNSHQAVPECFKLSVIKNVSTGDEYIATGGINLDGSWPSYDTTYDGQFTLYAIANQPDIPRYKNNTVFGFDDSQQYIYVGPNISHDSVVSNCSELDVSLVSSNGGRWHCIVENARDGYVARVIQATGDLSNTQIGWSDYDAYVFLNTPSGTSGSIYVSCGIKGAEYGLSSYMVMPSSFTPAVITKAGSEITMDNLGLIEQYTGATDATYTNGYFYKATGTVVTVPESIEASVTNIPEDVSLTIDATNFINAMVAAFGWSLDHVKQCLIDYGSSGWNIFYDTDNAEITSLYIPWMGTTSESIITQHITVTYTGSSSGELLVEFNETYTPVSETIQDSEWVRVDTQPVDLTGVTGYDATKTQVLKNVQGVLTWVDE